MGLALRRKLAVNTGLSDRILNATAFWEDVCGAFAIWASDTFADATDIKILDRELIQSDVLHERASAPFSFLVGVNKDSVLGGIRINKFCAAKYGASRLGVTLSDLDDVPDTFLILVFEKSLQSLFSGLQAVLEGSKQSLADHPLMVADCQCLVGQAIPLIQVDLECQIDNREVQISLWLRHEDIEGALSRLDRRLELPDQDSGTRAILATHVKRSGIKISAVLDRMKMTLGECVDLSVGQILPLSDVSLEKLSLSVDTLHGELTICDGRLGSLKNSRAIQITTDPDADFLNEIGNI